MAIQNLLPFKRPLVSYLQQMTSRIEQVTLVNSIEDSIKKLTSIMEELVVSVKNNNKSREMYNDNRGAAFKLKNAPQEGERGP
ncbi:hypothetical protein C2G38_2179867 [Gigaspora rosea]|uniref:Uncharacterized protein n=1 Tax=Gigaspora rosea TaxID=44941 RepID=A0A397VCM1_9GLOM|nr:hypothetical protein C2G38_2179867 [Gigaspora rosea]